MDLEETLSCQEQTRLINKMLDGDACARQELILHNLRLVAHIAKKYKNLGLEERELISIGTIGLIKALDTYRPEKGNMATYAGRCIENEMLLMYRAYKKTYMDISMETVLATNKNGEELCIGDTLTDDKPPLEDKMISNCENRRLMQAINAVLKDQEKKVLMLRFGLINGYEQTQQEIAYDMGVSRSRVSKIERTAISKLRRALADKE